MEGQAYIGELLAGIIYLIVGLRLRRLGQRTGEAPERLLACSFLCMSVSTCFYVLPNFPAFESMWMALNFAGRVMVVLGVVFLTLFTRCAFRPDTRWASWLLWATAILLVTGVGGAARAGEWDGFSIYSVWFQLEWVGFTLPYVWTATETLAQYVQARRRVRLGLCARLVCNRYLLWASFAMLQIGLSVVILPQYAEYEATNQFTAKWDAIYGAIGIASLVMIWLVFFPPVLYRRWMGGETRSTPTAES